VEYLNRSVRVENSSSDDDLEDQEGDMLRDHDDELRLSQHKPPLFDFFSAGGTLEDLAPIPEDELLFDGLVGE